MNRYHPVAHDGRWHVAYRIPGTNDEWSSVCDCPSYQAAVNECAYMNEQQAKADRADRRDQKLRGVRGQQVRQPL